MPGPDGKIMHAELRFGDTHRHARRRGPGDGSALPADAGRLPGRAHALREGRGRRVRAGRGRGGEAGHASRRHVLGRPVRAGARPVRPPLVHRHPQGRPHAQADEEGHGRVDGLAWAALRDDRAGRSEPRRRRVARARAGRPREPGARHPAHRPAGQAGGDGGGGPARRRLAPHPPRHRRRARPGALGRAAHHGRRPRPAQPTGSTGWPPGPPARGAGAFGLAGLAVELPVSTTLMLRAIADHARAQGEDLSRPEPRLQCLAVFAYGSPRAADDAAEAGYFAVRAALARSVSEAAEWRGLEGGLPRRRRPRAPRRWPGCSPRWPAASAWRSRRRPPPSSCRCSAPPGAWPIEPGLHEPLPAHRLGPLHREATGAGPRRGRRPRRLGPVERRPPLPGLARPGPILPTVAG